MQPLAQLCWVLPETHSIEDVLAVLNDRYTLAELPPKTTSMCFYDSFDWRLYDKKRLCFVEGKKLYFSDFTDNQLITPVQLKGQPARFWWQFTDPALQRELSGILDMRALLPQATFGETVTELRVLNRDEKSVATILLTVLDPGNGETICSVQLREIRGYQKWFMKLSRELAAFGTAQADTMLHRLTLALAAMNRQPRDYSSGFSVSLSPEMNSLTAVKTIYATLLTSMQRNEQGILDDLDSEFLHDFRVAIRRTRSALTLIKGVLEPEVSDRFKAEFRYLGSITGSVRDLDVYLLMEDDYKARLPEHLQEGLHYFFEDLAKKRSQEQKKLIRAMHGSRYRTSIDDWQEYLEQEEDDSPENRMQPEIGSRAKKIIRKRFQRVLRDGRAIHPQAADEELHRLRIQGKKLRYCLEFFSSLYPEQKVKQLIKQLKLLQNNLGLFNDLSVQQEMLNQYLHALKPGTIKSKKLSAAIGGLLTNLYHEQQRVRTRFEKTFARFASEENLELYRSLFK
jgi:CHAD domain-containing protein